MSYKAQNYRKNGYKLPAWPFLLVLLLVVVATGMWLKDWENKGKVSYAEYIIPSGELRREFQELKIKEENAKLKKTNQEIQEQLLKVKEANSRIDNSPKGRALGAALKRWGVEHLDAFENLVKRESNFNPHAKNGSSGACGMFQAHPCSKLLAVCPDMDVDCQINWGLRYIESRYGNPSNAWKHWLSRVPIAGKDVGHWY